MNWLQKLRATLDLIKFATIICYEIEYSLYTLWQFMRRVWRLGQTKPVKVLFLVYQHTLEEAALALIGEKMKAALLLYGDNAASAITADADAGEASLLNELANRILKGEHLTADGVTGLLAPAIAEPQELDAAETPFTTNETFIIPPAPEPAPLQPIVLSTDDPTTHRLIWAELTLPPKPSKRQRRNGSNGETQLSFFQLTA